MGSSRHGRTIEFMLAVAFVLIVFAACTSMPTAFPPQGITLSPTPLYGKFIWRDLLTEDPAAAKHFYAGLLGWQYEEKTAFGEAYTLIKSDGQYIGGIVKVKRPQPDQPVSQWLGYVSVPDVDRAVAQTKAAGGRLVDGPTDIAQVGRGAVIIDPQGAPIGFLHTSFGDPADTAQPTLSHFLWTEYLARDPQDAVSFYSTLLGYETVEENIGSEPYYVLKRGRARAGVLQNPVKNAEPIWLSYVMVANPASAAAKAAQLGGRVLLAPRKDVRNGTLAIIADPSGAVLALQKWPI